MKLIRQTRLRYQQGKSDKVYEIDLCEAGEGEFIVNFRYGRSGSNLREGTKTPFPETRPKAEEIFSKLTAEKTGKGYQIADELGLPSQAPAPSSPPEPTDPRIQPLLTRLQNADQASAWKLSRAVFRAGQWQLSRALPFLLPLANRATGMDAWCLAFALGRCGNTQTIPVLEEMIAKNHTDSAFLRIAREAKLALLPKEDKAAFFESLTSQLPTAFLKTSNLNELTSLIEAHLETPNLAADLYLLALDRPVLREALYSVAKTISPTGPGMLLLRQLFKAAEFRLDAEVYGCLARRFDTTPANGSSHYDHREKKKHLRTFSSQTKKYLQRRVIRTLKTAGEDGDASTFIPLATGILLAYDDEIDNPVATSETRYDWSSGSSGYTTRQHHFPPRKTAHSFLWLLRDRSPELSFTKSLRWHYRGEPSPSTTREEPFPELWDAAPDAVAHLLAHSKATDVQEFSHRIWKAHPAWGEDIETSFIIYFLSSWYEPTSDLGLHLAKSRWNPADPYQELLLGMLSARSEKAQTLGGQWLHAVANHVCSQPDLIARLAFIIPESSRTTIRSFFDSHPLAKPLQKEAAPRLIAALLTLTEEDTDRAEFATEILKKTTPDALSDLPAEHLAELAAHPLERLQLLSATILLHQDRASSLPEPLLLAPLSSAFSSVRRLGLELLFTLSSSELGQRAEVVTACALSPHSDLRENIAPLLGKIARTNSSFCRDLIEQWYPLLLRAESLDDLHRDLFRLLTGPLAYSLNAIPSDTYPRMLASKYAPAQALGFVLLQKESDLHQVELSTLIEWAIHPHAELRAYIWKHFESQPRILTEHLGDCLPLLETSWTDSRERAFQFFRETVDDSAWTPESLVAICDSTQTEAQSFGREMITRRFQDADGPFFLSQLSQHPSTELQIFASNYLMRFAVDHPDRITILEPYFRTVLSKIGAGRTAKKRIFTLLEQEALKDENTAHLVTTLLDRLSATIAIEDKATCIHILLKITARWPSLATPLKPLSPKLRQPYAL